jgi:hypothetical protein
MYPTFVLPSFILGVALLLSSYFIAGTIRDVKLANQTITVKGLAEKKITSDTASWSGRVNVRNKQLVPAYNKLQADLQKTTAWLEQNGIKPEMFSVSAVQTTTLYATDSNGNSTGDLEGYTLSQAVEIHSDDVQLIDRLSKQITSLIQDGVEFESFPPQFFYTQLDTIKIDLLGEATADARHRADKIAEASGCKAGIVRSAQQGVFQITPVFSSDISNDGSYDTSSIDKKIKAVVTVDYAVRD